MVIDNHAAASLTYSANSIQAFLRFFAKLHFELTLPETWNLKCIALKKAGLSGSTVQRALPLWISARHSKLQVGYTAGYFLQFRSASFGTQPQRKSQVFWEDPSLLPPSPLSSTSLGEARPTLNSGDVMGATITINPPTPLHSHAHYQVSSWNIVLIFLTQL